MNEKQIYIAKWEIENYELAEDLKMSMMKHLSIGQIVSKLKEWTEWRKSGGVAKTIEEMRNV